MQLDNNNHSVFLLYYHLVLVVKYRRNVIDNKISERLKMIFERIAASYNYRKSGRKTMNKAYKYRLYPNSEQAELINKTFGCVRFVYNQMLVYRKAIKVNK